MMWDKLVAVASENEVNTIWGITKAANRNMRAVAKKLGRAEEESINLRYDL